MPTSHPEAQSAARKECVYCRKAGTDVRTHPSGFCLDCHARREAIATSQQAAMMANVGEGTDLGAIAEKAVQAADALMHFLDRRADGKPSA